MSQKKYKNLPQALKKNPHDTKEVIKRIDDRVSLSFYKSVQGSVDTITGAGRLKEAFNRFNINKYPYDVYESRVVVPITTSILAGLTELVNLVLSSGNDHFMNSFDTVLPLIVSNIAYLQAHSVFTKGKLLNDHSGNSSSQHKNSLSNKR
jgi:hypothetical protein